MTNRKDQRAIAEVTEALKRMNDSKIQQHRLTYEQRQRAVALESAVGADEYSTAAEIIFLRDRVLELEELTGPLVGQTSRSDGEKR